MALGKVAQECQLQCHNHTLVAPWRHQAVCFPKPWSTSSAMIGLRQTSHVSLTQTWSLILRYGLATINPRVRNWAFVALVMSLVAAGKRRRGLIWWSLKQPKILLDPGRAHVVSQHGYGTKLALWNSIQDQRQKPLVRLLNQSEKHLDVSKNNSIPPTTLNHLCFI